MASTPGHVYGDEVRLARLVTERSSGSVLTSALNGDERTLGKLRCGWRWAGGAGAGPPPGSAFTAAVSCSSSVGLAMGCSEQRLISRLAGRLTTGPASPRPPPSPASRDTASLLGMLRPL